MPRNAVGVSMHSKESMMKNMGKKKNLNDSGSISMILAIYLDYHWKSSH